MKFPIEFPPGWSAQNMPAFGVVITAKDRAGYVTVDEKMRDFEIGMSVVRTRGHHIYVGRGWKVALYNDAVKTLQAAIV